jgi:hypothetical protein
MPKATLTFDLPEDQYDFKCSINGSKYLVTLQDVYNAFRSKAKHEKAETTWDDAYELFKNILNDNGLDPWEEG